ncbi:TPA: hypothetical protein ACSP2U_003031 [Aeromonas veronii]
MDTLQLYRLSIWYQENIKKRNFISSYDQFISWCNECVSNRNTANYYHIFSRNLKAIKDKTLELHNGLDIKYITSQEKNILDRLNISDVVLQSPIDTYDRVANNGNGISTLISILTEQRDNLARAENYFQQTSTMYSEIFEYTPEQYSKFDGENVIKIRFKDNAAISNVSDLKFWAEKWYKISRGFSGVVNGSPEDFKVSGAANGSIVFDIVVNNEILKVFLESITSIAETTTAYFAFKTLLIQMKGNSGSNSSEEEKISEMIEKTISSQIEQQVDLSIKRMIDEGVIKDKSPEIINNLKMSLDETRVFLEKGGSFELRADNDDSQERVKIAQKELSLIQRQSKPSLYLIKNDDVE